MSEQELKPCEKCNRAAVVRTNVSAHYNIPITLAAVMCDCPSCEVRFFACHKEAIKAWNTRAKQDKEV